MKIPTIKQFKQVAEDLDGVHFYGEYQGKYFYEGIGLQAESTADAASFMVAMSEAGFALPAWDHQDQLGLGVIVAWEHENFVSEVAA